METPRHVFLSHASRDRDVAVLICSELESAGLNCWLAPRDIRPGQEYGQAIVQAIAGSQIVLVLWSCHSEESEFVRAEIERAASLKVPRLLVRLDTSMPGPRVSLFLSTTQHLDYHTGSEAERRKRLLASLGGPHPAQHAAPAATDAGADRSGTRQHDRFGFKRIAGAAVALATAAVIAVWAWPPGPNRDGARDAEPAAASSDTNLFARQFLESVTAPGTDAEVLALMSPHSRTAFSHAQWTAALAAGRAAADGAGPRTETFHAEASGRALNLPTGTYRVYGSGRALHDSYLCELTILSYSDQRWWVNGYRYWPSPTTCLDRTDIDSAVLAATAIAEALVSGSLLNDHMSDGLRQFAADGPLGSTLEQLRTLLGDWRPTAPLIAMPMSHAMGSTSTGAFVLVRFAADLTAGRAHLDLMLQRERDGRWRLAQLPMLPMAMH